MEEIGFSIRCPHCFGWSDWPDLDPRSVAVRSPSELERLLRGAEPKATGPRLFGCQKGPGECPAPIQAFVCTDRESAHRLVQNVPTWTLRRAFRLFKSNRTDRWPEYSGAVFCTRPVPRQKHIELELLLDREILSRAMVGISRELQAPITLYAVSMFETGKDSYLKVWLPVEAYRQASLPRERLVPPEYSPLCQCCRWAEIESALATHDGIASLTHCPASLVTGATCGGRQAACAKADWNRCPSFLMTRRSLEMCYDSDCGIIASLEEQWRSKELPACGYASKTCWLGLTEIAVPIVVHDHFVAIAMTGQFVSSADAIPSVDDIVQMRPALQRYRAEIERARQVALTTHTLRDGCEHSAAGRPMLSEHVTEIGRQLRENSRKIEELATSRYHSYRLRSESVFRQQVLSILQGITSAASQSKAIEHILSEMGRFWAFKGVYLFVASLSTKEIFALCHWKTGEEPTSHPFPGLRVGMFRARVPQLHPLPWLYDWESPEQVLSPWVAEFQKMLERERLSGDLGFPPGGFYFSAAIPFADEAYIFLFTGRDEAAVSPLRPLLKGGISDLCQAAILETCTEVARRIGETRYRETRDEQVRLEAWRELAAKTAHSIDGRTVLAIGGLRRLKAHVRHAGKEALLVAHSAVARIAALSHDFRKLSSERSAKPALVNLREFLQAVARPHRSGAHGIVIQVHAPDTKCRLDPMLMDEAISELIKNAVAHTPRHGHIRISARLVRVAKRNIARITVFNHGGGIASESKQKIFKPFVALEPGGTGLGLAIVEQTVRKHGGEVYENGEQGSFARFIIDLPGAESEAQT